MLTTMWIYLIIMQSPLTKQQDEQIFLIDAKPVYRAQRAYRSRATWRVPHKALAESLKPALDEQVQNVLGQGSRQS
jgi:hypothetical protein